MTSKSFVPEVGSWAEEKLSCLRHYLTEYTTILRKQKFKGYVYIDAFAGAGTAKIKNNKKKSNNDKNQQSFFEVIATEIDGDQEKYISGSPKVALDIEHPFTQYIFIERDVKRLEELRQMQITYGDKRQVKIYDADSNTYIHEMLSKNVNWKQWRGVIFLDPFGTQAPWKTVEAIAKTKSFEVFINFPCMAINRLADNDGNIRENHRAILDEYFGSPTWFDIMFDEKDDLFGETLHFKKNGASKKLLNWYRDRLKSAFGYASSARLITNSKNSPLYYLIWAGPNKTGHKIADYILSKGTAI